VPSIHGDPPGTRHHRHHRSLDPGRVAGRWADRDHLGAVWVDSWQMQCCGEPLGLGSQVAWTLCAADPDWLHAILGADAQRAMDAPEEHHGSVPNDTEPDPRARSRASRPSTVASCPADSDSQTAVPGTGSLPTSDRRTGRPLIAVTSASLATSYSWNSDRGRRVRP
jgi:hypothetical protein